MPSHVESHPREKNIIHEKKWKLELELHRVVEDEMAVLKRVKDL